MNSIIGNPPEYKSRYKRTRVLHNQVFQRELQKLKDSFNST
jgi:hypothetical protein